MRLKVRNFPNLERDSKSKAIINVDTESYNEYLNKKRMNSRVLNMSEEIEDIKSSVNEIKNLLSQILQRTS
jgi:ABC-type antimicrobial peptide transport system permease subunit